MLGFKRFETAAVTIRGIALAEKIKKQQFNLKPLTGKATTRSGNLGRRLGRLKSAKPSRKTKHTLNKICTRTAPIGCSLRILNRVTETMLDIGSGVQEGRVSRKRTYAIAEVLDLRLADFRPCPSHRCPPCAFAPGLVNLMIQAGWVPYFERPFETGQPVSRNWNRCGIRQPSVHRFRRMPATEIGLGITWFTLRGLEC